MPPAFDGFNNNELMTVDIIVRIAERSENGRIAKAIRLVDVRTE